MKLLLEFGVRLSFLLDLARWLQQRHHVLLNNLLSVDLFHCIYRGRYHKKWQKFLLLIFEAINAFPILLLEEMFSCATSEGTKLCGSTMPSRIKKRMSPCSLTAPLLLFKLAHSAYTIIAMCCSIKGCNTSFCSIV